MGPLGGVPREQKMLKGHLPSVMYHQVLAYEDNCSYAITILHCSIRVLWFVLVYPLRPKPLKAETPSDVSWY